MKKIYVTKTSLPKIEDYIEKIETIWDTHQMTNNGRIHMALEQELKEYLKVDNLTLFTNGHLALYTAIKSLNLEKGGEVITTPFTFASTTNAIVENGLIPVFCDIDPLTYTIDVNKIESLITDKTCAILPVHVYGNICDVIKLEEIANKYNLKIIYDAAHVFGVKYKGNSIFNYGDISMTSFHATKVFNTIEGGALFYKDARLYERFNALKNFGIDSNGEILEESINAKMNEFQAAMGLCNLKNIDETIEKRKKVYLRYMEKLKGVQGVKLNKIQKDIESNYAYFPILFNEQKFGKTRDEIYTMLADKNIFARKYFYPLVSDYAFYRDKYNSDETPIAQDIAKNILCLPLYPDLSLDIVDVICNIILGE